MFYVCIMVLYCCNSVQYNIHHMSLEYKKITIITCGVMLEIALQKLIENGCSMLTEGGTYGNISVCLTKTVS